MSLTPKQQFVSWGLVIGLFILVVWILNDILLPFVLAMALAYLIDPLVDRLERVGLSRILASLLISAIAILVLALLLGFMIPVLIRQVVELVELAPTALETVMGIIRATVPELLEGDNLVRQYSDQIGTIFTNYGSALAAGILQSARAAFDSFIFLLILPIIMVYLLIDWDRMVSAFDSYLPREHADEIRRLVSEMDTVLSSFVRGQLSVCAIMAVYYSLLLMIVGLNFGLVAGIVAGLLTFIPFVGAVAGGALAFGLAIFQFWNEPWFIALVVVIFFSGQILEGNFLTPKIVGGSIGLHPVMLIFSLSAFGSLFGLVGMLVAVPLAAVIGVLFRFGLKQYLGSRLYKGRTEGDP